ncbi:hypothetical protein [Nocardia tengchongensis]
MGDDLPVEMPGDGDCLRGSGVDVLGGGEDAGELVGVGEGCHAGQGDRGIVVDHAVETLALLLVEARLGGSSTRRLPRGGTVGQHVGQPPAGFPGCWIGSSRAFAGFPGGARAGSHRCRDVHDRYLDRAPY